VTDLPDHDLVLVVDFGAQYAQLIARRVREAKVYSELVPHTMPVEQMLAKNPKAIVLSGGPQSVFVPAPRNWTRAAAVGDAGLRHLLRLHGDGRGARRRGGAHRPAEYGRTSVQVTEHGTLLDGLPDHLRSWMSHGDEVVGAPAGFTVNATSARATVAAFEDVERKLAGVQWHPEVLHSEHGQDVLEHFLVNIAGCRQTWTMVNIVEEQLERIREQVGDKRAICGLSGGVDSAVAAALVQRAIGDRLTCVFVDHGLLRKGEAEQVERDYVAATGVNLKVVDSAKRFLDALAGVSDPETKRKIIGREFIRCSRTPSARWSRSSAARSASGAGDAVPRRRRVRRRRRGREHQEPPQRGRAARRPRVLPRRAAAHPVQGRGTHGGRAARAAGGDRVAAPFPGPGLAIRIIGAVDEQRLAILREADAIAREEVTRAGMDRDIWQFPVVLLATYARSASRATGVRTGTRSSCGRSPARTR
jgi:GMP synthase (glutamine-hydrolysing)